MFRKLNRFFVVLVFGFSIYLIFVSILIAFRLPSLRSASEQTLDSLAITHGSNLVFFLLVGAVGLAAQFFDEHGDVLRERLRRMFASRSVSYPVLEYFESVVRANCVFAEEASHEITILEYNKDLKAYRGTFHNKYHLRNAFGDVPYDAELSVEVSPDMIRDGISPLAVVSELKLSTSDGKVISFVSNPQAIDQTGFRQPIRITLPPNGTAIYELSWWSWIAVGGNSGFSQKRFAERFIVSIVNRSLVTPQIELSDDRKLVKIPYGGLCKVADIANMPPRVLVEFSWGAPEEYPDHIQEVSKRSFREENILDFERKLGEPDRETF